MDLDDLLKVFLGTERFARAQGIAPEMVQFTKRGTTIVNADVKGYVVSLDLLNKTIYHDCTDWTENRSKAKLFCKHIGRFFLNLKESEATEHLREILRERDKWVFDVA